jgi:glycine dehydrogenase subunit 1
MRYIPNTPAQQKEMLGVIGAASIEDLLVRIPAKARLSRPLNLPAAMAEMDLVRHLRGMAGRNAGAEDFACFLGAGSYDHSVPSPINHLISRGEFVTAYTPYQPEASQGTLRTIFEYQTMIAELTGMDVANASLYDGGSSLAEGANEADGPFSLACLLGAPRWPKFRRISGTRASTSGPRSRGTGRGSASPRSPRSNSVTWSSSSCRRWAPM